MILGLDISTSITGFAIVAEGEIVFYDSVDLRKYKNLFEKAERIKEAIFNLFALASIKRFRRILCFLLNIPKSPPRRFCKSF